MQTLTLSEEQIDLAYPSLLNAFRREKPRLCILSTILLVFSAVLLLVFQDTTLPVLKNWMFYVFFAPSLAIYLIDCARSPVVSYLYNQMDYQELTEYLEQVRQIQITVVLRVYAYHFKHMDRKITYRGQEVFYYRDSIDFSDELTPLLQFLNVFRLNLNCAWRLGNKQAVDNYELQKANLIDFARTKDCHYEVVEIVEAKGIKNRILTYPAHAEKPPLFSLSWYILFSLLGLSLPFRIYFNSHSGIIDHLIKKQIRC